MAALLHDVGIYVSLRSHHKHTQYILAASQIFGLSDEETGMVANIARYHRGALPQKTHLPYVALDREDRITVDKLAAILRIANALDAEHVQKVRGLRLVRRDTTWMMELDSSGDLTMERLAATARSDLFVGDVRASTRDCAVGHMNPVTPTGNMFLNRELSWLAFNERVLEEAARPSTPLLERVKFVAIAASNLDEFFMVRVAALEEAMAAGDDSRDLAGWTPADQLRLIRERAHAFMAELYGLTRDQLLPGLAERHIRIRSAATLGDRSLALGEYFRAHVLPVLTPLGYR